MRILFTTLLIFICSVVYANQKAITDTGEEVILYSDGTWEYSGSSVQSESQIKTNSKPFQKPEDSTFLLKSKKNNSAYWINTNKWSFKKATDNKDAEYQFQLKGEDLWGMSITEGVPIPIESLANIALENAKAVALDAKTVKQEYRIVNGIKILYMEIKGTLQGIKFKYLGYYYSDDSGSTQFIVYTGSNLVSKYQKEINSFLNGLTTQ